MYGIQDTHRHNVEYTPDALQAAALLVEDAPIRPRTSPRLCRVSATPRQPPTSSDLTHQPTRPEMWGWHAIVPTLQIVYNVNIQVWVLVDGGVLQTVMAGDGHWDDGGQVVNTCSWWKT